jgi:RNA polymerase sigma-70 factor (ECF subfamily)
VKAEVLEPHRGRLVDLAYRMTGDVGVAEDLVQDAFVTALQRPPADLERSLRPWLTRVVANRARDELRRRRRRGYVGPWLPTPVASLPSDEPSPEGVARQGEVVGWATLLAMEALTPQQRAVWVLREVAELTAPEVAEVLDSTPTAVRAAHTRARRALRARRHDEPLRLDEAQQVAWQRLSAAILAGDLPALRAALCDDATMATDGGGEVSAATRVVLGADRVARLLLGLARGQAEATVRPVRLNDRPAMEVTLAAPRAGQARTSLLLLSLADDGRVAAVSLVAAPSKLRHYAAT